MSTRTSIWTIGIVGVALLASTSSSWGASLTRGDCAGEVLAVDRAAGTIVVGDMGPLRADGESKIARRSIRITSATEFVTARRAEREAPSGWTRDYVETRIPAWDVKTGDFVAVKVANEGRPAAVKITVVDTTAQ